MIELYMSNGRERAQCGEANKSLNIEDIAAGHPGGEYPL